MVKREDTLARLALLKTQKDAMFFLQRIRQIIGVHLSQDDQLAVHRQYGLAEIRFYSQERLLQLLSNIIAVSAEMEDEALKLSAEAITTAENFVQGLQDGLEKRRHFKAQKIALREERMDLIKQFRHLRTKIYGFLMENMSEGSRDPRLISFGFRPSNLRRRPGASEDVTIVEETEASENVVSVVNEEVTE